MSAVLDLPRFPRRELKQAGKHRLGDHDFDVTNLDALEKISRSDAREFWMRYGYLHVPSLVSANEVDALWADVELAWRERPNVDMCVGVDGVTAASLDTLGERPASLYRLLNFHQFSDACLNLAMHKKVMAAVAYLLVDEAPVLVQTLTYEHSSEQSLHVDYLPVRTDIPHRMLASWIACEDVSADAGPLVYVPGSHRIDPMGIASEETADFHPHGSGVSLNTYLMAECWRMGLKKERLLAKKGDVFFWHAALLHGGSKVMSPGRTRKSLVSHYSTLEAYPRCNFYANTKPRQLNGGWYYEAPLENA